MSETTIISKLSESKLVKVLEKRESKARIKRVDALKELSHRRSHKKLSGSGQRSLQDLAEKHATNPNSATELRMAATVALGKVSSSTQQPALCEALQSGDAAIVKLAAISLGRTGDETAIDALEDALKSLRRRRSSEFVACREAIEFAMSILSYRHGIGSNIIRPTPASGCLKIGRRRQDILNLRTFKPDPITRVKLAKELKSVSEELRAIIPIFKEKAWTFSCGADEHLLVFNDDFLKPQFVASLKSKNALAAVILDRHSCTEGRFISEYFLTNPARSGRGTIVGVRPLGDRAHAGDFTLDPDRNQVEFSLRAVNQIAARAIDFEGIFDLKEKRIELRKRIILEGTTAKQRVPLELTPEY